MTSRLAVTAIIAIAFTGAAFAAQLPNFDAVADAPRINPAVSSTAVGALAATSPARVQWDDRFGVPTFVWPSVKRQASSVGAVRVEQSVEAAARQYVADYAPLYGLTSNDVNDAYVANVHDTGRGAIVVKFRQKIGGVPVFRDEMNVILNRERNLVALSGHISPLPTTHRITTMSVAPSPFLLSPATAIAATSSDVDINALRLVGKGEGDDQTYEDASGARVRARRVYFHLPDHYEPSYYVEMYVGGDESTSPDLYSYVVSAIDGHLLFRNNMTWDDAAPASFSYRVWAGSTGDHLPFSGPQGYDGTPNPTGTPNGYQPAFIQPNLIALPFGPISTKDPWLADNATETNGNNADAFVDLVAPDGFSTGDFRANTSAALTFDRTYDLTQSPASTQQQQMAAITQLFYDVNFLHDWYYDAGFNEAAGNAQTNNYGRGGLGNDNIRAEAQDYGGRNNANMAVPSDGGRPRMQMYVWDGASTRDLAIDAPSSIAKSYVTGYAIFGPQSFNLSGDVVATTPADGCTAITTNLTGKIAFIDRGGINCTFVLKAQNAKAAGAIGIIVGNVPTSNFPDSVTNMACSASPCPALEGALPPAMHVALSDANAIRANVASGIHLTMRRDSVIDRDGTIDNQIVAHEWMHYMSNRLIADANGLVNLQSRGMGEGWSDFNSLLLTTRPDDLRFDSNANYGGAYALAIYAMTGGGNGPLMNNGDYYGIRRVPYSTDMTKNPLTLKHVMNGNAITGAPLRAGADGANNSEVHNTGEVWCTMLWEAYTALLRDTLGTAPRLTFAEAQQRMKEYLVTSMKATPESPTIIEARDALLAAAFARDKTDYREFWQAFAKRGAGVGAVAPERYSSINAGVTEDFNGSGGVAITSVAVDDSVTSCLKDGVLDAGETGVVKISLRNTGGVRLASTTMTVTSSEASLSFANEGKVVVPATDPGDAITVSINATLAAGATSIVKPDVTITVTDPQIGQDGGIKSMFQPAFNAVEAPKDTTTDDVESATSTWTVTGSGASRWTRTAASARDHRWFAGEPYAGADTSLISPPLVVGKTGTFSFSFMHRYGFDWFVGTNGSVFVDGGVIEISTDDGQNWIDIGNKIDPSTPHYVATGILAGNGSSIENRKAFAAVSPGFNPEQPSLTPFTKTIVNLGTDYAGKRVRIRFHSVTATDHSAAARTGWEIDDIKFDNIVNMPFASIATDQGLCSVTRSTTSLAASATKITPGQPVTLSATVNAASAMGTVDFFDNGAILGTARVANGKAELAPVLVNGAHAITAVFNGGKYFTASTSAAVIVSVGASRHRSVGK